MNWYALFCGYIVTANRDGSIPLNAKVVTKVDDSACNPGALQELIDSANRWKTQEAGL